MKYTYNSSIAIWPKLENSRVLVLGGTGFIGKWLVASLGFAQLAGHSINLTIISRDPKAHFKDFSADGFKTSWIESDVSKPLHLDLRNFSHVINAATPSSAKTGAISPRYVYDSIVHGNSSILSSPHNPEFRYIFLSSGAVSQLEKSEPDYEHRICESEHLDTLSSAYSHGKRFAEIGIARARETNDLNAQSLRLFAFAGPGLPLDQHFAVGNFMQDYVTGRSIEVKGNPNTQRSYMYPTDLVSHILMSLTSSDTETTEVGSTEVVSIGDLATLISSGAKISGITEGDFTQPMSSYFPASNKILNQRIDLEESIKKWKEWLSDFKN